MAGCPRCGTALKSSDRRCPVCFPVKKQPLPQQENRHRRTVAEPLEELHRAAAVSPRKASQKQHRTLQSPETSHSDSERLLIVLEVTRGPHTGQRFEFDRHDTFLVGRSSRAQLCLHDDPHFSRNHFRIEVSPPRCYLVDLGSNNGTKVNGRRIRETFLADGDIISGGRTEIVVRAFSSPASAPAAPASGDMMRTIVFSGDAPADDNSLAAHPESPDDNPDSSEPIPSEVRQPQVQLSNLLSSASRGGSDSCSSHLPKIPNYEIVSELGRGAMGVVYRAVHKATRQQVAVKLMLPGCQATPSRLQLFAREASILSQLSHPCILRFLELGTAGDHLFIVAEYVETIALSKILEGESPPSQIRICCGITCRVLKALEHAHSLSLVHRDIKPANILLSRQGRKLHTKIADFGLAKNYEDAGLSEMTKDGEVRGSPAYMSPEQIISSRYAKPACDLYSVGVTLYEFLCGKLPFDISMGLEILRAILEDPPIPVQTFRPDIPEGLAAVIERSLAKDSADRFESAEEMYRALIPFGRREILKERRNGS